MNVTADKLTNKSREALLAAQQTAQEYHHSELKALHVLWALFKQENGLTTSILEKLGINRHLFETNLEQQFLKAFEYLPIQYNLNFSFYITFYIICYNLL